MTASLFISGIVLLYGGLVFVAARYLGKSTTIRFALMLFIWLAYVGALSASGVISNSNTKPPGIVFIALPVVGLVLSTVFTHRSLRIAQSLPLVLITALQVFRIGVELGLYQLWTEGLVPHLMTYEGGNIDIYIGLSAPIVAFLWVRGQLGLRSLQAWNIIGLLALANIMLRAVLTTPSFPNLFGAEVPNLAIGLFPYTYIAGFLAPLALILHVLSLRHIQSLKPTDH
jgi:hypothetical protein